MLNSIIEIIQEVQTFIIEELYELPLISPKATTPNPTTPNLNWFPVLEEIVIHE